MLHKIFGAAVLVSLLMFTACQKKGSLLIGNDEKLGTVPKVDREAIVATAFQTISSVLPQSEFNMLDWNNLKIEIADTKERSVMLTISTEHDKDKKLVYLDTGNMKIYQWKGEVHVAASN